MSISPSQLKHLASECGFELAGIAAVQPSPDYSRFEAWRAAGHAAGMGYLTDHRGDMRQHPRNLLSSAESILCVGKLYHTGPSPQGDGSIASYAHGLDYHLVLRHGLQRLAARIQATSPEPFEFRICVDTAPLLERSLAHAAGLGWIGKNTCLINQPAGSWFFLGEMLLSIPLAADAPAPDRCGTCTRCIDACPTEALIPGPDGGSFLDSSRCISYLTIEHRGSLPAGAASLQGTHLFGCDICQDVCPWNRKAPATTEPDLQPRLPFPDLAALSGYSRSEFTHAFGQTPVARARYTGFLRNVAVAMGNSGNASLQQPLTSLANSADPVVAATARESLQRLRSDSEKDLSACFCAD